MQNGPRTIVNSHRLYSVKPLANRSRQWTSNVARPEPRGWQNAQKNYEHYLALAKAQAQAGDIVGAENYYQHAEHYFRTMMSDREPALPAFGTRGADWKHDR